MTHSNRLAAGLLLLSILPLLMYASSTDPKSSGTTRTNKHEQPSAVQQTAGERKFAQNCSRCHNAPEAFSPHISGTIVRHMRVRASLSAQDERDILHFLNP
jgi:mono/diheme cytochrome c family protein